MAFKPNWRTVLQRPDIKPDVFTNVVKSAIRELLPGSSVEYVGELELEARLPNELKVWIWLGNIYSSLPDETEARIDDVERFARSFEQMPVDDDLPPPDIDSIIPQIKDDRYIAEINQLGDDDQALHVTEPFAADLQILYSIDTELSIRPLREDSLPVIGIGRKNLRETALDNLKRILPPIETQQTDVGGMLVCGGTYEASLLLLDDLWAQIEEHYSGALLGCVPARDMMLFGNSDDPRALEMIYDICDQVEANGGYLISRTVLIRKDAVWQEHERRPYGELF